MRFQSAGKSDKGVVRTQNQDSFLVSSELSLFVVADGMGGHKGGETASQLAISTISDFFTAFTATSATVDSIQKLKQSIVAANEAIQKYGTQNADLAGMGTTTTALYFDKDHAWIGHVGDSRAYLIKQESIWQLTRDHSIVQEKLRAGLITREQAKSDKMKNIITRSVGFEPQIEIDIYDYKPHVDDIFLLCSDGLSGMIEDDMILKTVLENGKSMENASEKLIELANQNGGEDNVTVILVQVL